jgi:hypothetical protein
MQKGNPKWSETIQRLLKANLWSGASSQQVALPFVSKFLQVQGLKELIPDVKAIISVYVWLMGLITLFGSYLGQRRIGMLSVSITVLLPPFIALAVWAGWGWAVVLLFPLCVFGALLGSSMIVVLFSHHLPTDRQGRKSGFTSENTWWTIGSLSSMVLCYSLLSKLGQSAWELCCWAACASSFSLLTLWYIKQVPEVPPPPNHSFSFENIKRFIKSWRSLLWRALPNTGFLMAQNLIFSYGVLFVHSTFLSLLVPSTFIAGSPIGQNIAKSSMSRLTDQSTIVIGALIQCCLLALVSLDPFNLALLLPAALGMGAASGMISNSFKTLITRSHRDQSAVLGTTQIVGGCGQLIAAGLVGMLGIQSGRVWIAAVPFVLVSAIWVLMWFPENENK